VVVLALQHLHVSRVSLALLVLIGPEPVWHQEKERTEINGSERGEGKLILK
jgi:hypothetical protein